MNIVRFTSLVIVLAALVPVQAADPTTPIHWSAARTKELVTEAASKVNKQTGMSPQRFMDSAFMMYREKSSGAEIHTGSADFIIVNDGEGTIVIGGKMLNGKLDRPGEIRGESIDGGTPYAVRAGDTLYVPKNAPHQFLVEAGRHMVYTVVKVTPVE
jgi:mannose-6-phosphate isomerase-like protein (cupin superfamily)